jgi:hypothetical protein
MLSSFHRRGIRGIGMGSCGATGLRKAKVDATRLINAVAGRVPIRAFQMSGPTSRTLGLFPSGTSPGIGGKLFSSLPGI